MNPVSYITVFLIYILQGRCIEIFCPQRQIPFAGGCLPALKKLHSVTLALDFSFHFKNREYHGPHFLHNKILVTVTEIHSIIKQCTLCSTEMIEDMSANVSTFYLRINITTTEECQFQWISDTLNHLHAHPVIFNITSEHGTPHEVTLQTTYKSLPMDPEWRSGIHFSADKHLCPNALVFDEFVSSVIICPSVIITAEQLAEMGLTNSSTQQLFHNVLPTTQSRRTAMHYVCIDEYLTLVKHVLNQSHAHSLSTILIVCSMFCTLLASR